MTVENIDKAAILLLSMGSSEAAKVLKFLGPKEVQRLGVAMASQKNIQRDTVDSIVVDFLDQAETQTSLGVGSEDKVKEVLVKALGEDKASGIIDKVLLGANTKGLDTLKWMEAKSVADYIRNEHPQIQAIVLSYLESDQAAQVLSFFDERVRLDIILRIANQESIQPRALQELNDIMEKQFSKSSSLQAKHFGGIKTAAEIMNYIDSSVEAEIMDSMREKDDDLAQAIQDLMFVFDNLLEVDDRGMQTILREVSTDNLILALKGADNLLKEKIFANMSKRAADLLKDDLEAKGPVRVSEVETAQKEILGVARKLAEAGEISLGSKGGEEMI